MSNINYVSNTNSNNNSMLISDIDNNLIKDIDNKINSNNVSILAVMITITITTTI